ncbi:hypothetical protein LM13656_60002 [Listeria monocytogenes]|nr:hypothetical protein LM1000505_50011 [Listeria monocytogenes]CUK35802.1 hypothetical protein LM500008_220025 [Listeria monocytogenes]CUK39607.1 hypothetical protein LM13656_60002 [Listeria monocytogenes]CUK40965.1 hypothetical protein LM500172_180025 [Listeria monocytogenes]CUK45009.1 hypothetical protein LM500190_210025 [Listeria monocytogenes]
MTPCSQLFLFVVSLQLYVRGKIMISTDFTKGASFSEKGNTYFWHLYFYPRNHSGNNCRFIFSNGSFCHDFFMGLSS